MVGSPARVSSHVLEAAVIPARHGLQGQFIPAEQSRGTDRPHLFTVKAKPFLFPPNSNLSFIFNEIISIFASHRFHESCLDSVATRASIAI